jgi:hypothetical protein
MLVGAARTLNQGGDPPYALPMRDDVVERLKEIVDITGVELEEVIVRLAGDDAQADDVASCLRRAMWQLGAALEITEGTRQVWPPDGKRARELEDARRRRAELRAGQTSAATDAARA